MEGEKGKKMRCKAKGWKKKAKNKLLSIDDIPSFILTTDPTGYHVQFHGRGSMKLSEVTEFKFMETIYKISRMVTQTRTIISRLCQLWKRDCSDWPTLDTVCAGARE
ncbi:hypothetical protein RJ639_035736 [Escallonia herrerae]|uniref:Uncharacterized protein n=1 Tax=Escallonia herrerae TaxID=1293975 RepID=A0AA88WTA0_9ASTE|nr:hypothetical protein RJ639_035736 [Escallonia herrerae]